VSLRSAGGNARPLAVLAGLVLALAACKQGPDFFSPAEPEETGYTAPGEATPPSVSEAETKKQTAQRIALGAKVKDDWWTLFHSAMLDGVIKQALTDSPTIAQARAVLAQARELVIAAEGARYPQVDLNAGIARQAVVVQITGTARAPIPVNDFSVGPTVGYTIDVFGAIARTIEGTAARADISNYQLAAAYLVLTGNITNQAITIAGLQAQIKTVEDILADDERNLTLVKTAQAGGTATMVDVTTAEAQLANDRTLLPPLRQQLSVARDALTVYAGRLPADWSPPDFQLTGLTLPKTVPLSLPSLLVRQRPDILAAEAALHAASADVGVATANLYPTFTISAAAGQQATMLSNFFENVSSGWGVGVGMAAPIFHGGTLTARQRAAQDAFDAAWAGYRQVVIQAFGQVADLLQALAHDDEAVHSQQQALAVTEQALKLARLSYAAGNSTLLQLLDPERQMEQARLGLVRAETQRLIDTAQLLVALGSGWWNTPPTPPGTQMPAEQQTAPEPPTVPPSSVSAPGPNPTAGRDAPK
jgi:NodT family efflux transporter outer membrane factor (OMF) lipoprotein